jgi:hypothetical protein
MQASDNSTLRDVVLAVLNRIIDVTGGIPQDFQHYDDFGWWALALVNSAQNLGGPRVREYIVTAETVFQMQVTPAACFVNSYDCVTRAHIITHQQRDRPHHTNSRTRNHSRVYTTCIEHNSVWMWRVHAACHRHIELHTSPTQTH